MNHNTSNHIIIVWQIRLDEESCPLNSLDTEKMAVVAYYRVDVPWLLETQDVSSPLAVVLLFDVVNGSTACLL